MSNTFNIPDNFDNPPFSEFSISMTEEASVQYDGDNSDEETANNLEVLRVKNAHEARLLSIDGVVGIGIQQNEIGDEVIWVYLRDESVLRHIPSILEGIPVQTEITGEIEAY